MILIGLGANLEGPFGPPDLALRALPYIFKAHNIIITAGSSIWKTAPVPLSDQPWYYNAVCSVKTDLDPLSLLREIKRIEFEFGRKSSVLNAPRVIDLDLLAYDDKISTQNDLIVPHPRLHERAFVLYPLKEIAPDWVHPVSGQLINDMVKNLPDTQKFERLEGAKLC